MSYFGQKYEPKQQRIHIPPQYTLQDVLISPFDAEREYAPDGRWHWKLLPRKLAPTGIEQFDALIRFFAAGNYERSKFYQQFGISDKTYDSTGNPFFGFVFVLTGMSIREFHNRYCLATADLLLQYTDLDVGEVARRSGSYDASTLNRLYRKYHQCTTKQRRIALRKIDNRVGFYRIAEVEEEK